MGQPGLAGALFQVVRVLQAGTVDGVPQRVAQASWQRHAAVLGASHEVERVIEAADPTAEVTVDLENRRISGAGITEDVEIDDYTRWRLLEGLDDDVASAPAAGARLWARGAGHVRVYGGGGGVIVPREIALLHEGSVLVGILSPALWPELLEALAARGVTDFLHAFLVVLQQGHVRAQVTQQHGAVRPGQHPREVRDAHAGQGQPRSLVFRHVGAV